MRRLSLQIDDAMARQLERVAPARGRRRSRFIRLAIQKALMDLEEVRTREEYARHPDAPATFDAKTWGEWRPKRRLSPKR
jgi:predicted transcriptional regulator